MQTIAILGSTGSVGTQTCDVIFHHQDLFKVSALAALKNDELLEEQIHLFQPRLAVLVDEQAARRLRRRYSGPTRILSGPEGLIAAATEGETQTVVTSLVGFAGLRPTIAAIRAGKNIALANKETLVAAGEIVTKLVAEHHVRLLPVDSEHSAIFQCLQAIQRQELHKLYLTASGGPFRDFTAQELSQVTLEQCLKHPTWSMGPKITIDSSTLANKGLEVIEAHYLFDVSYENITVVIHPQSIVHSMIQTVDGSVIAQLGQPDMRLPIQYALSYPARLAGSYPVLDFKDMMSLNFSAPDMVRFPALRLAYEVGKLGRTFPCVYNAANETAVTAFMHQQISYQDIAGIIDQVVNKHTYTADSLSIDEIFAADEWARIFAAERISLISGK
jgi:1-deoxy-D-xylulose-5-phosphate reductoisomerase